MELLKHIEILGLSAAVLGTISLIPQVIKIWRTHSTQSISLVMYLIICTDSILWLIYGILLSLRPLIIQSTLTFVCALAVIIMKILWKTPKKI